MVNERGNRLRKLGYDQLKELTDEPTEQISIGSRSATISIIVQLLPSDRIRVVVQGFMKGRLVPMIRDVALDGFYKSPDETIAPLTDDDMYKFD